MTLSNKAIGLSFETKLTIALQHISELRHQLSMIDMKEEIGNESWFSQAGHPLSTSKDLAFRLLSQSDILARDIKYIIENGSI